MTVDPKNPPAAFNPETQITGELDFMEMNRKINLLIAERAAAKRAKAHTKPYPEFPAPVPASGLAYQGPVHTLPGPNFPAPGYRPTGADPLRAPAYNDPFWEPTPLPDATSDFYRVPAAPEAPEPVYHIELGTDGNGRPIADSLGIATRFGKRHDNVVRDIRVLVSQAPKAALNFEESFYRADNGKNEPCFLMNRDGFSLLVMGFTGKDAIFWKLAYIDAFNRMEAALRDREPQREFSRREMAMMVIAAEDRLEAAETARLAAERNNHRLETIASYQNVIISKQEEDLIGLHMMTNTEGSFAIRTVVKLLGQKEKLFNKWLREKKFTFPYHSETGELRGYQPYADKISAGYMVLRWHNDDIGYDAFDKGCNRPTSRFLKAGIIHVARRTDLPYPRTDELYIVRERIRRTGNPFDGEDHA